MKLSGTVGSIGEFSLIDRLAKLVCITDQTSTEHDLSSSIVGIGDDAAVIPLAALVHLGLAKQEGLSPTASLLVTVDTLVEERHFRRRYCDPFSVGWKLLASSLSDIAAMGGRSIAAVVSLSLPVETPVDWIEDCYRGLTTLAKRENVQIVGGDTVSSQELSLSLTLLGITDHRPCLRSAAKTGEDVWISGRIGDAGAGFRALENSVPGKPEYITRFLRPEPQAQLGQTLAARGLASAMCDVSDGLLQDLGHIAHRSQVTIELFEELLPVTTAVAEGVLSVREACTAGEDYELVWTAPPSCRQQLEELKCASRIGRVVASAHCDPQVILLSPTGGAVNLDVATLGFDHFKSRK